MFFSFTVANLALPFVTFTIISQQFTNFYSFVTGINIQHLTFAGMQHSSAFTTKAFDKGHMFGPFQGKNVYTSEIKANDGNSAMWEVFILHNILHKITNINSLCKTIFREYGMQIKLFIFKWK